ncbi:MAG TPA: FAD-binding oxidoreductase, partial [Candidatus Atribacteria bacterium]|nr:FAD-binding oxidoreductase [Candidatus Atribacteria bacterium]
KLLRLLKTPGFNKYNCMPFTILPKPRIFIKPDLEEKSFWIGYADDFNRAFKLEEDPQPEENYYRYGIYPIVSLYLPQFSGEYPINAWAGQYAINTLDQQPVIFEVNNIIVVGAASGSGIMKADAIGRIAAALYYGEEEAELFGEKWFKVSDLGIENRRIEREKFVI